MSYLTSFTLSTWLSAIIIIVVTLVSSQAENGPVWSVLAGLGAGLVFRSLWAAIQTIERKRRKESNGRD